MANPAKRRGDKAELEAAAMLTELTGKPCRRMLGAGRSDDVGDIDGLDDVAVQVANWADTSAAAIQKPRGAQQQALNAQKPLAITLVRFKGGTWRVVLTPEQWLETLNHNSENGSQ